MFNQIHFSKIEQVDENKNSKCLSREEVIRSRLDGIQCINDEALLMWDCQVCLLMLRLEIRLNNGIVPRNCWGGQI